MSKIKASLIGATLIAFAVTVFLFFLLGGIWLFSLDGTEPSPGAQVSWCLLSAILTLGVFMGVVDMIPSGTKYD